MPPRCIVSSALRPGIEPDLRASKAHVATTRRRELRTSKTKAPAAGIEPATKRLTVALPYQHRTRRNVNGVRRTRNTDSKHGFRDMNGPVRVADSQPRLHAHKAPSENRTRIFCMASRWVTTTPWAQNASLPNCQRSKMPRHQEHRAGIEPASPRYDGGVLPLDHQCQFQNVSVGPVRIELTSFGLRDRCITLSATIPSAVAVSFQSLFRFSRRGGN